MGKHRRYHMETRIFGHCEKGMVISQNVSAGEWVSADQKLVLTISKGQGKTVVPKLRGLTLEQAKKKLKKVHLTYKIQREESNKAVDTVLSQSVAKGKRWRVERR